MVRLLSREDQSLDTYFRVTLTVGCNKMCTRPTVTDSCSTARASWKVPVFSALDTMTGEITALVVAKKRSGEFSDFLY